MTTTIWMLITLGFNLKVKSAAYGLLVSFIVDGLLIVRFG